jgi:RpoD_Cterm: RNA polymerase sigma factor RpoD
VTSSRMTMCRYRQMRQHSRCWKSSWRMS